MDCVCIIPIRISYRPLSLSLFVPVSRIRHLPTRYLGNYLLSHICPASPCETKQGVFFVNRKAFSRDILYNLPRWLRITHDIQLYLNSRQGNTPNETNAAGKAIKSVKALRQVCLEISRIVILIIDPASA